MIWYDRQMIDMFWTCMTASLVNHTRDMHVMFQARQLCKWRLSFPNQMNQGWINLFAENTQLRDSMLPLNYKYIFTIIVLIFESLSARLILVGWSPLSDRLNTQMKADIITKISSTILFHLDTTPNWQE